MGTSVSSVIFLMISCDLFNNLKRKSQIWLCLGKTHLYFEWLLTTGIQYTRYICLHIQTFTNSLFFFLLLKEIIFFLYLFINKYTKLFHFGQAKFPTKEDNFGEWRFELLYFNRKLEDVCLRILTTEYRNVSCFFPQLCFARKQPSTVL